MLLIFVILIPLQVVRARREAAVLEAEFGDEYREYRKRTWF
jgi:protein-S-isoprenylcysteine O-methyltransferase Ste14